MAFIASIFRSTPGASLRGMDQQTFVNLQSSVDQSLTWTTEPSADLNEASALLVFTARDNQPVMSELVFYLRRSLGSASTDPKKVEMVLQLINCIAYRQF